MIPDLVENPVEFRDFVIGQTAHYAIHLVVQRIHSGQQVQPFFRDGDIHLAPVIAAIPADRQSIFYKPVHDSRDIRSRIQHLLANATVAGRFRVLSLQDSKNVELLHRELVLTKHLLQTRSNIAVGKKEVGDGFVPIVPVTRCYCLFFLYHCIYVSGVILQVSSNNTKEKCLLQHLLLEHKSLAQTRRSRRSYKV